MSVVFKILSKVQRYSQGGTTILQTRMGVQTRTGVQRDRVGRHKYSRGAPQIVRGGNFSNSSTTKMSFITFFLGDVENKRLPRGGGISLGYIREPRRRDDGGVIFLLSRRYFKRGWHRVVGLRKSTRGKFLNDNA